MGQWWAEYFIRLSNYLLQHFGAISQIGEAGSQIRQKLPLDMETWQDAREGHQYDFIWDTLAPFFELQGYDLWTHEKDVNSWSQIVKTVPSPSGYFFRNMNAPSWAITSFNQGNGRQHALRGADNRAYLVAVVSVAGSGDKHLNLLKKLAASNDILLGNNHILPLIKEIFLEDIIFAIFPMLGNFTLRTALGPGVPKKSLNDALHIAMQVLEAVDYIHGKNIAHRDLFLENFLIEWVPMSLNRTICTRPRVYLIDFETAVEFSDDISFSDRSCDSLPFPDASYGRPMAPEFHALPLQYNPFLLDVWQISLEMTEALSHTGISEIDNMWGDMMSIDPTARPSIQQVLARLCHFMSVTPHGVLHIPYNIVLSGVLEAPRKALTRNT